MQELRSQLRRRDDRIDALQQELKVLHMEQVMLIVLCGFFFFPLNGKSASGTTACLEDISLLRDYLCYMCMDLRIHAGTFLVEKFLLYLRLAYSFLSHIISLKSLNQSGHQGHMWDKSTKIPIPVFSFGGCCEQFWHGLEHPLFDVVHPAVPLQV